MCNPALSRKAEAKRVFGRRLLASETGSQARDQPPLRYGGQFQMPLFLQILVRCVDGLFVECHSQIVMVDNKKLRRFCLTWNNPPATAVEQLIEFATKKKAVYAIFGRETGETGTPHIQGYVHLQTAMTFTAIKSAFPALHLEKAKGTAQQNKLYCSKEENFEEMGKCPQSSGDATKQVWRTIFELASNGDWTTLQQDHPRIWVTMSEKLKSLRVPRTTVIQGDLQNEWWYGETGTGKSRLAWEKYGSICYQKMLNKWWDGYDDQPVVVIEEWSPKNEVTSSALKIWADRYPFTAQIKGGVLQKIRPLKIIVISNYRLSDCFPDTRDAEPISRRFKQYNFPQDAGRVGLICDDFISTLSPAGEPEVDSTSSACETILNEDDEDSPLFVTDPEAYSLVGVGDIEAQAWVDYANQHAFSSLMELEQLP